MSDFPEKTLEWQTLTYHASNRGTIGRIPAKKVPCKDHLYLYIGLQCRYWSYGGSQSDC